MAGDWIKVEKATLEKPEVLLISQLLNIHPVHAFGLCVKFWMWCDDQLVGGNAKGVTKVTLDYVIGHDGMTDALLKVDWLRDRSGSLEVPHFDRHLSEGAKNRALTKERVRKSKEKSNGTPVKKVTQTPLPEKRREDKNRERERADAQAHADDWGNDEPSPAPSRAQSIPEQAHRIVEAYPRREKIASALQIVEKHLKDGESFDAILSGTKACAKVIAQMPSGASGRYVPGAERFFLEKRWQDDPETIWRKPESNNGHEPKGKFKGCQEEIEVPDLTPKRR